MRRIGEEFFWRWWNYRTAYSEVTFKKLIDAQLVEEFPVLCGAVRSELSPPDSDDGVSPKPYKSSSHRNNLFFKDQF
jgi:hypothetical protein